MGFPPLLGTSEDYHFFSKNVKFLEKSLETRRVEILMSSQIFSYFFKANSEKARGALPEKRPQREKY